MADHTDHSDKAMTLLIPTGYRKGDVIFEGNEKGQAWFIDKLVSPEKANIRIVLPITAPVAKAMIAKGSKFLVSQPAVEPETSK